MNEIEETLEFLEWIKDNKKEAAAAFGIGALRGVKYSLIAIGLATLIVNVIAAKK